MHKMSRGVRFNFVPDEYILCFEPDMTKARVLYNAKVFSLDHGAIIINIYN